jgi:hypothetical protein
VQGRCAALEKQGFAVEYSCLVSCAAADPGEGVPEGDDLASKHISIPGMDGFFIYQLHYKTVRRLLFFASSADDVISSSSSCYIKP